MAVLCQSVDGLVELWRIERLLNLALKIGATQLSPVDQILPHHSGHRWWEVRTSTLARLLPLLRFLVRLWLGLSWDIGQRSVQAIGT